MDINDLEKYAKPIDTKVTKRETLGSVRRLAKKYAKDVNGIYKETKFGAIVKTKNCTVVFTKGGKKNARR